MTSTRRTDAPCVSYRSLPHKGQLLILLLARLTEPLTTSSIHSYILFQLQYLSPTAPASTLATQAGLLIGCKTFAHVCTGLIWGRFADNSRVGRKKVLVIGLLASSIARFGYGYSRTFKEALLWQIMDGALNATIAMVRCMTAELNPQKRYRVRALTLLPLSANIGSLLGPLIGGFLASSRSVSSATTRHPYAAPNICVASVQGMIALIALFYLSETINRKSSATSAPPPQGTAVTTETTLAEENDERTPLLPSSTTSSTPTYTKTANLGFWKIWTPNVISTMMAQFIISGHLGTFAILWTLFLSFPTKPLGEQHVPFRFSGGFGLHPYSVGIAMSTYGFAGIALQILFYPRLQERWGTIRLWRAALCVFPVVYTIAPFCALVASINKSTDNGLTSVLKWTAILLTLAIFAAGRTGVVPATTLLINDCTPHPSVRGTIHTTGVIVSNLSQAVFPPMALAILGYGFKVGVVGLGFWFVAALAILSYLASMPVREGTNGAQNGTD